MNAATQFPYQRRINIQPGKYAASKDRSKVLYTLLGSCVAVCLYDPINNVAGMNHIMVAKHNDVKPIDIYHDDAGRYGMHAMELLINEMVKLGAERKNLKAKAFGGSNMFNISSRTYFSVGDDNIKFVKDYLRVENIELVSSHLGGNYGRNIYFDVNDYTVYQRRMDVTVDEMIRNNEKKLIESEIEKRKQDIDIVEW